MPTSYTNTEPSSVGTSFTAESDPVTVVTATEPSSIGTTLTATEPSTVGTAIQRVEPLQGFGSEPFGNPNSNKTDMEVGRGFGDTITSYNADNTK